MAIDTAAFAYDLPETAIAQAPVEPRHDARLLDARSGSDHRFFHLPELLEKGDLVVVNQTRVRHARLTGTKRPSGGAVEALLLRRIGDEWEALVKPARRIRSGTEIQFGCIDALVMSDPVDGIARLRLRSLRDIESAIHMEGSPPLPPYIHTPLGDPGRYQTMFADGVGSSAAPTAGLHFTDRVVERLASAGIGLAAVTLEVGLATFRPISTDQIEDHSMHAEKCEVPPDTALAVAACRRRGNRIVAIGTTVVRTLETFGRPDRTVCPGTVETDLYLRPGCEFRVVDLLVTNFHMPRSSLLVMVEAFMGPGWREVYALAQRRGYRFLSFGDAMLCARPEML